LLVLGAGRLGALLQQALLEQREGLHAFLPGLHGGLGDFVAQFALEPFVLSLQRRQLLLQGIEFG